MFDHFSRFVVTVSIPDKSARTVCSNIYAGWIAKFGCPDAIRMDAGTEFTSSLLTNMMKKMGVHVKVMHPYNHQSNPVERFHRTLWNLLRAKLANGEKDWEAALPAITLAYNAASHSSTKCSPARGFLGREVDVPHVSVLPKFNPEKNSEPCTLEEEMDRVWEEMRVADDVRIRRQFKAYSGRQEDLQVGDYVYAAVLPAVTDSRKLCIKWSGPLVIKEQINGTMFRVTETKVKSPRTYTAHRTKLRLAKRGGQKDINPSFFLPRISKKEGLQMEDALSTVILPARVFDDVEDEFCSITRPQGGMSLSGSTGSSTAQARSEKSASQGSRDPEDTVQEQIEINPQQEEQERWLDRERIQSSPEKQREESKTPEELFVEHFEEPVEVRDEILEEDISDQVVITTPASRPQEDWQQLRILEDSLTSAASSASSSTIQVGGGQGE